MFATIIYFFSVLICCVVGIAWYWHYKQQKKGFCCKKYDVSPSVVLVVTSEKEWEEAYDALISDLGTVKVNNLT